MRGTRGTETSKYPEEKKITMIPKVVASEIGEAQTAYSNMCGVWTPKSTENDSRIVLESTSKQGNRPVGEIVQRPGVSGVRRDTRNLDGRQEDHLLRLNTTM